MPPFKKHCQDCIDELGEPYEEVHKWLDELFEFFGSDHRPIRHNVRGVEKVRAMWGEEAARAAKIHILADEGEIPEVNDKLMLQMAFKPHIYEAFKLEYGQD